MKLMGCDLKFNLDPPHSSPFSGNVSLCLPFFCGEKTHLVPFITHQVVGPPVGFPSLKVLRSMDPKGRPLENLFQWLFLVPLKGGLGGIVHPPIGSIYIYTTYIPLIVLAFWLVVSTHLFTRNVKLPSGKLT